MRSLKKSPIVVLSLFTFCLTQCNGLALAEFGPAQLNQAQQIGPVISNTNQSSPKAEGEASSTAGNQASNSFLASNSALSAATTGTEMKFTNFKLVDKGSGKFDFFYLKTDYSGRSISQTFVKGPEITGLKFNGSKVDPKVVEVLETFAPLMGGLNSPSYLSEKGLITVSEGSNTNELKIRLTEGADNTLRDDEALLLTLDVTPAGKGFRAQLKEAQVLDQFNRALQRYTVTAAPTGGYKITYFDNPYKPTEAAAEATFRDDSSFTGSAQPGLDGLRAVSATNDFLGEHTYAIRKQSNGQFEVTVTVLANSTATQTRKQVVTFDKDLTPLTVTDYDARNHIIVKGTYFKDAGGNAYVRLSIPRYSWSNYLQDVQPAVLISGRPANWGHMIMAYQILNKDFGGVSFPYDLKVEANLASGALSVSYQDAATQIKIEQNYYFRRTPLGDAENYFSNTTAYFLQGDHVVNQVDFQDNLLQRSRPQETTAFIKAIRDRYYSAGFPSGTRIAIDQPAIRSLSNWKAYVVLSNGTRAQYTARQQSRYSTRFINLSASTNPLDINGDGRISSVDALNIINHLNQAGSVRTITYNTPLRIQFLDTNGDGFISPLDYLVIINRINRGY